MNQYTVVGKKSSVFKDKDTGKNVVFGRLYTTYEGEEDTEGLSCEVFKMNPELFENVNLGDLVEIACNQKGRVEKVYICA
jgi:hypothetical protein